MSNYDFARHLGVSPSAGDHAGQPICCFFVHGHLAAIRTKRDEIALFHVYESLRAKMEEIGELIS